MRLVSRLPLLSWTTVVACGALVVGAGMSACTSLPDLVDVGGASTTVVTDAGTFMTESDGAVIEVLPDGATMIAPDGALGTMSGDDDASMMSTDDSGMMSMMDAAMPDSGMMTVDSGVCAGSVDCSVPANMKCPGCAACNPLPSAHCGNYMTGIPPKPVAIPCCSVNGVKQCADMQSISKNGAGQYSCSYND